MTINEHLLNSLLLQAQDTPRKRMHFDLRTTPNDNSHRMLNAILPESEHPIHRHRDECETVILLRGKAKEIFYNDEGDVIEEIILDTSIGNYGVQVPVGQWHSIKAITPCVVMAAMNGAFATLQPEDILEIKDEQYPDASHS